jgi:tetratricopeptide (TPR) repeat protein
MKKLAMLLAVLTVSAGAATCAGAELAPDTHIIDASSQAAKAAEEAGDLARLHQDYANAAADYQKALRLDPTNSLLYNKLGIVEFKLQNERAARKSFNLAIKYDARNDQALNNLGALELVQRRYKPALNDLKQALALDESDASAHVNIAEAWMGLGQVDRAMTEYSRALELDADILTSSDVGVLAQVRTPEQEARIDFLIAKAYAKRGNADGALDYLGRAKNKRYPSLSEVYSDQEFALLWNDPRLTKIVKR